MPGIYYATTGVSIGNALITFTHSLSRTPANLRARLTPKNATAGTAGAWVAELGTNVIALNSNVDVGLFDVEVMEVHSIQGGPNGG